MNTTNNRGTLITVGFMNNDFQRLFDLLHAQAQTLPEPIVVQKGPIKTHPFFDRCHIVKDFFSVQEMEHWSANSDVLVSHAGVGSLKLGLQNGMKIVLIPRSAALLEHVDDHQTELARKAESLQLAHIVYPGASLDAAMIVITAALAARATKFDIIPENIVVDTKGKFLAVTSVGGHRSEISRVIGQSKIEADMITDEACSETRSGEIAQFPSCRQKWKFPLRVAQALFFLRRNHYDAILTAGAGVGAVFIVAGRLSGIRTYCIESMTRIDAPSKWFTLSMMFATQSFCFNWASWSNKFPKIKVLNIKIEKIN